MIVTETTETVLDADAINNMLINIGYDKEHLVRQNQEIVARYNRLVEEENELKEYLANITNTEPDPLEVL